jgi:hypothetical protein
MTAGNQIRNQLRTLDRLITHKNDSVRDLVEQAMVLADIADESAESYADAGPLEIMYNELQTLRYQIAELAVQKVPGTGTYWNNNTSYFNDPTRNYPAGWAWDPENVKVVPLTGSKT